MQFIPKSVLGKLYNRTSLRNEGGLVRFSVKNRLSPAVLKEISQIAINGQPVAHDRVSVAVEGNEPIPLSTIGKDSPLDFPLGTHVDFCLAIEPLKEGHHDITLVFDSTPFGRLSLEVQDSLKSGTVSPGAVPRDHADDYSDEIIRERQAFIRDRTGAGLKHIAAYSFDPHVTSGNIEHFTGVAQVPMGFAGPLLVHGEHANGEFGGVL